MSVRNVKFVYLFFSSSLATELKSCCIPLMSTFMFSNNTCVLFCAHCPNRDCFLVRRTFSLDTLLRNKLCEVELYCCFQLLVGNLKSSIKSLTFYNLYCVETALLLNTYCFCPSTFLFFLSVPHVDGDFHVA